MAQDEILKESETRMKKSVESVKSNFNTVRTGRANPSILDRVLVPYYGVETPINQMASIAIPSSNTIQIDPYDKSVIGDLEKALMVLEITTKTEGLPRKMRHRPHRLPSNPQLLQTCLRPLCTPNSLVVSSRCLYFSSSSSPLPYNGTVAVEE